MGNTLCNHAMVSVVGSTPANKPASKQCDKQLSAAFNKVAVVATTAAEDSRDEIEVALCQAREELDAAGQHCFADDYTTGRIIGHGAFCKVQVCTHNQTGQECAVKVVQKTEDNLKQREGERMWARINQSTTAQVAVTYLAGSRTL